MSSNTLHLRSADIPHFYKFGVGFDTIVDELLRISQQQSQQNYPPYNVVRDTEDKFTIEVAVAGFEQGEIDVTIEGSMLVIRGEQTRQEDTRDYLHKGISARDFTRSFGLAEHVEVIGAEVTNGILSIKLERQVPESAKPKAIAITYNR